MLYEDKEELLAAYANKLRFQNQAREVINSPVDRIIIDKLIEKYGLLQIEKYIQAKKRKTVANGTLSIIASRIEREAIENKE